MIEKWEIPYPAFTGEEPRNVYVYVPDDALDNSEARFPVLYMFDGHNVFFDEDATYGKSWSMGTYLDFTHTQLMVVAVECNHAPNNARLSEYAPFTFQDARLGRVIGRGEETMRWFIDTLKPMIDERYPTLPNREHTFIAGSSMGGLMSLYAATAFNHVFSRAAALSPSIWMATRRLDQLFAEASIKPDTVIYMDYGSREMRFHPNMARRFSAVTARLLSRRVQLTSRIVPEGNHCEASWERQLPFFISVLLYNID